MDSESPFLITEFDMRRPAIAPQPAFVLTLLCAAALTACGGGGDPGSDDSAADADTAAAANAALVAGDATAALDTAVLAAQAVVSTQAASTAAGNPTATALSAAGEAPGVQATAVADVAVACPGGGSAMLTITGGSAASLLNGQFDAGEVYTLVYADCRGALGAAALNGTLGLAVQAAGATELALDLTANSLSVALPRGSVTLTGSSSHALSSSTGANGTTLLSSRFTSPGLTLATRFNARSSSFTLSAVDIARQSTWLNGVLQSSSIDGTHTLSATLVNGAFSYTVATQGGVSYSETGTPVSGAWTITLPVKQVNVSVSGGTATIEVDDGKDGTIDRTFIVTVGRLESEAG
jgi:hypothetical protein